MRMPQDPPAAIWARADDEVVAFGPQGDAAFGALRLGAERLATRLASLPARRWALCFEDSLLFAEALLACALTGREAILPGHQRPAALAELSAGFDGVLTDSQTLGRECRPLVASAPVHPAAEAPSTARWSAPPPLRLTLFTSGSTGQPKAIPRPGTSWMPS